MPGWLSRDRRLPKNQSRRTRQGTGRPEIAGYPIGRQLTVGEVDDGIRIGDDADGIDDNIDGGQ